MDTFFRIMGVAFYMLIPLGVLALCISIIYKKITGKSVYSTGSSFVGQYLFQIWETQGKKEAVEEIQYEEENKRDDAESGDPHDKNLPS